MPIKKNFYYLKKSKISHGFFTRLYGFSKKQFKSLNCSKSNGDNKRTVDKNRLVALRNLQLEDKKLILNNQTHSSKVVIITKRNLHINLKADGMITSLNDIVLGVLTADCAPIFIYDNNKKIVCCLHSGWRGTLDNISNNAVLLIDKYNIKRNNLNAIIGPCLGTNNYEVDEKFRKKFVSKNSNYLKFFRKKNSSKFLFNLRGIINFQLKELGIKNIHNINRDTYFNKKLFFSHRRSTHSTVKVTGRLINLISLT